jgi:hypothetical protein
MLAEMPTKKAATAISKTHFRFINSLLPATDQAHLPRGHQGATKSQKAIMPRGQVQLLVVTIKTKKKSSA